MRQSPRLALALALAAALAAVPACSMFQQIDRDDVLILVGDAIAVAEVVETTLEDTGRAEAAQHAREVRAALARLALAIETDEDLMGPRLALRAAWEAARPHVPEEYLAGATGMAALLDRVLARLERRSADPDIVGGTFPEEALE